ncbi:hypothetical protein GQX73_g10805 [Xylaria multiplex]|uniref:Prion-inhibition and propagation HeLo domain-containing protein n=1 Tax=Xylaria multiplex TaxID=323545 RepID=A0A7C8MKA7_9PEZI|nr:hypothetical protein GQX73_g10805 [Xylaria multiplex]
MSVGLEILGSVAASLELVKVAKSCLSIFNELRHAEIQERDQGDMQFHLIVQGLKFDSWCSSLGIQNMFELSGISPDQWQQKSKVKEFEDLLQSQLRFRSQDLAAVVLKTLKSMEQKFNEAEKLMGKYAVSTGGQTPSNSTTKSIKTHLRWTGLSRRTKKASPALSDVSTEDVNPTERRIGNPISNVRWVARDKGVAQELLESIEKVNKSLVNLVQSVLQAQIGRQADLAVLDSVDHRAHTITQSLPEGSDVRALASMRQWQIQEQRESEDHDSSTYPGISLRVDAQSARPITYSIQDFGKNNVHIGDSRSFSTLDGESVVVEWRYFNNERPFRVEQSLRLADLVRLLNQNNLYQKFQALPCKGYVTDDENSRVGMVFTAGLSPSTNIQSLQTIITSTTQAAPPVGERFAMARRLVLAIHNLHAVRWLHKGIRSDNIICFRDDKNENVNPSGQKNTNDVVNETENVQDRAIQPANNPSLTRPPNPLPTFYLLGWDLSRPDHPSELSESISISTLGFQSKREIVRMYTHPDVFSTKQQQGKRSRYHARWDIYSVGLILLEIGLWRTLESIRYGCKSEDEFRLRVRTEYCDRLQAKMGLVYWRAVQRCLHNDFDLEDEGLSGKEDYSLQVGFEKQVVFELERCFA